MSPSPLQQSYIGGCFVASTSGETFDDINPATGEVICRVEQAGAAEVEKAVAAAQAGLKVWSAMTGAERGRILHRAAQLLRERNREIAKIEVRDTGKPIQEAEAVDILSGADCIEYYAGLAASLHGEHYQLKGAFAYTRREPLGICVGIGAWNYPIQIACWKSAPALACGNAMIFKPAELTPLTATVLAGIYTEAGLPPGVFNVIQGDARAGQLLVKHPAVAKVSLTGEVGTGKRVMADAAGTLKHVTMELGGKSPLIIFDDADLGNAEAAAMMGNFYARRSLGTARVPVHESIYDSSRAAQDTHAQMKIGDPGFFTRSAHSSPRSTDRVLAAIDGKCAARLVCGGNRVTRDGLGRGYFVGLTVFADAATIRDRHRRDLRPVMSVLSSPRRTKSCAAPTRRVRAGGRGVHPDLARASRRRAQAGVCWINNYNITPVEIPFGGMKQSGVCRERPRHHRALHAVEERVEMGDVACPY
jgi:betaine-aldehyde dehydrogenase